MRCGTNCQQKVCLDHTYTFASSSFFSFFWLLFHWMAKRSHHECLLEHLESSGTKIVKQGPIVRQLCVGRNRHATLDSEFSVFFTLPVYYFTLPVYYFSEAFLGTLVIFLELILTKVTI